MGEKIDTLITKIKKDIKELNSKEVNDWFKQNLLTLEDMNSYLSTTIKKYCKPNSMDDKLKSSTYDTTIQGYQEHTSHWLKVANKVFSLIGIVHNLYVAVCKKAGVSQSEPSGKVVGLSPENIFKRDIMYPTSKLAQSKDLFFSLWLLQFKHEVGVVAGEHRLNLNAYKYESDTSEVYTWAELASSFQRINTNYVGVGSSNVNWNSSCTKIINSICNNEYKSIEQCDNGMWKFTTTDGKSFYSLG